MTRSDRPVERPSRSLAIAFTMLLAGVASAQCPLPPFGAELTGGPGSAGAILGDRAIVGDPVKRWAHVFERDRGGAGEWGRVAKLLALDPESDDDFGFAVDTHGHRVVVGAPDHGPSAEGAVYVFERDAGGPEAWGQVAKLTARTLLPEYAQVGFSVAVFGDTLLAGAPGLTLGNLDAGGVFVFEIDLQTGDWYQTRELRSPTPLLGDVFGWDVALHENTAAIAEPGDGAGWFPGSVFLHERDLGGLGQWGKSKRVRASDPHNDAWFGGAVDLFGDTLLVGAPYHDHAGVAGSGGAYVFERDLGGPDKWGERQEILADVPTIAGFFAESVALHGDLAVIGNQEGFAAEDQLHVFERNTGVADEWRSLGNTSVPYLRDVLLDGTTALFVSLTVPEVRELTPTQAFTGYCTAGTSSGGCRATVSACGTSSASAPSGFLVQVAGAGGASKGVVYYGASGRQAVPWGNGTSLLCVAPPFARGPVLTTTGTQGACDGTAAFDLNARWSAAPDTNPGAGALAQAQFLFRDPASTSNRNSSLSDALELVVGP